MKGKTLFYSLVAVLALSTGLGIWNYLGVRGKDLRKYNRELERLNQEYTELERASDTYPRVKTRFDDTVFDFDSLKAHIPNHDNYVQVLELIRSLAGRQNVEIISLSPDLSDTFPALKQYLTFTKKHLARYAVQLRIQGDYLTIGTFLDLLLDLPTTITIGKVSMETELNQAGVLSCELVLYTYVFLEDLKTRA